MDRVQASSTARSAFAQGVTDVAPILVGMLPFALLLGALGSQKGLSPLEVALMSALVFAGSSQFLAIELWREPVPVLLLAVMALLVNARHVLMGAALAPRFEALPQRRVWPALFLMADEVWAMTLASERRGGQALLYFLGLGAGLYVSWLFWTTLGAVLGTLVQDPGRYGFDFAFVAIFLVLVRSMWRGRTSLAPWLVSGVAAAIVAKLVPGPWYVAAGAMAGLLTAALTVGGPGRGRMR
jgi:4-azaleucine resistance transporter AzlC